ncbi:hypothetical protein TWF718_010954 [Orbilia javanica]|uniref:Uncharacterized protein n=1 Tax=Orbilia javanica TaxID=47235 RepID=A0AAN8NN52_9PEZI
MSTRWYSTQPHIYTTPFDPIERITHYYVTINPHMQQWSITPAAVLPASKVYTPSQIKSAWKTLRFYHPIIAVTINSDEAELVYQVPRNGEEIEQWIKESVIVSDGTGKSGTEVLRDQAVPRSGQVYWIPEKREVVLHFPHQISDGIGSIILLNNFLRILRTGETILDEEFGNEVGRLPGSLFDTLGGKEWRDVNFGLNSEEFEKAEDIAKKFLGNDSISVSIQEGVGSGTLPTVPYGRVEYEFDEEQTDKIVKACKDKGITVTNAVMAANAFEMLKYGNGKKEGPTISNLVSVNYRPLIEEEKGRLQAGGNMFVDTFSVFEVDKEKGFEHLAKEVKQELDRWKNDVSYISYSPLIVDRLEEAARQGVSEGKIGSSGFVVSSLGIVEKYLVEEVKDFWFGISVASVGAGCLFIWTVRGRLKIAVCFNEAWFEGGVIEGFVEGLAGGLRKGLGLE